MLITLCISIQNVNCSFIGFLLVVSTGPDTEPPVISDCPPDIVVGPDAGQTFATVSWTEPTAVDNSGVTPNVFATHNPGDTFNINSVTVVTYTFWDARANIDQCSFTVTVTGKGTKR